MVVAATDCGRFSLEPGRRVRFLGAKRSPVPGGATWYPASLTWYRLTGGRLLVGQGQRTLWRSRGVYSSRGDVAVAVSSRRIAFSYAARPVDWRRSTLYVARVGGAEAAVARGESPLGWLGERQLITWGSGVLRLRDGRGRVRRVIARSVHNFVFAAQTRTLFFLWRGRLAAFDGRLRTLLRLETVGLSSSLVIEPHGRFLALRGVHRLVIARTDGKVVSSAPLPRQGKAVEFVSSSIAVDARGGAVFSATPRGNFETVYLLRADSRAVRPIYRQRGLFGGCGHAAALSWHGRWVLYSASEGYAAAINSATGTTVRLTRVTLRLPGLVGGGLAAAWAQAGRA